MGMFFIQFSIAVKIKILDAISLLFRFHVYYCNIYLFVRLDILTAFQSFSGYFES